MVLGGGPGGAGADLLCSVNELKVEGTWITRRPGFCSSPRRNKLNLLLQVRRINYLITEGEAGGQ